MKYIQELKNLDSLILKNPRNNTITHLDPTLLNLGHNLKNSLRSLTLSNYSLLDSQRKEKFNLDLTEVEDKMISMISSFENLEELGLYFIEGIHDRSFSFIFPKLRKLKRFRTNSVASISDLESPIELTEFFSPNFTMRSLLSFTKHWASLKVLAINVTGVGKTLWHQVLVSLPNLVHFEVTGKVDMEISLVVTFIPQLEVLVFDAEGMNGDNLKNLAGFFNLQVLKIFHGIFLSDDVMDTILPSLYRIRKLFLLDVSISPRIVLKISTFCLQLEKIYLTLQTTIVEAKTKLKWSEALIKLARTHPICTGSFTPYLGDHVSLAFMLTYGWSIRNLEFLGGEKSRSLLNFMLLIEGVHKVSMEMVPIFYKRAGYYFMEAYQENTQFMEEFIVAEILKEGGEDSLTLQDLVVLSKWYPSLKIFLENICTKHNYHKLEVN